jgi:DNA primase
MEKQVDIALVRRTVSTEQILVHYGLLDMLTRRGDNLVGPCPMHQGTNKTQFHVSLSKNAFRCFGDCGADPRLHKGGGNSISFVIKMEDIEEPDDPDQHKAARTAALLIADWFGIGTQQTPWKPAQTSPAAPVQPQAVSPAEDATPTVPQAQESVVNTPLKFALKDLDGGHPYLKERDFFPESLSEKVILWLRDAAPSGGSWRSSSTSRWLRARPQSLYSAAASD